MLSTNPPARTASPGLEKALSMLHGCIDKGTWRYSSRLPTLETLAAGAGVGRQTMWKALGRLTQEKLLFAQRGRGIFLGVPNDTATGKQASWRNIAARLADLIYKGEYHPGSPLPPKAKLQLQFCINYRTLDKALNSLVQRGLLIRTGARYEVPHRQLRGSAIDVLFFSEGLSSNEGMQIMLSLSDQLAHKMGIRLVRYNQNLGRPHNGIEVRESVSRDTVAGSLFDYWGLGTESRSENFHALLLTLHAAGKPVAIIDHVGDLELPEPLRFSRQITVLTLAARVAGEAIGRYLLSQGHHHAAFITIRENQVWSQRRYHGLKQAFTDTGFAESAVELFATEPFPDPAIIVCAAARLLFREIVPLFPERSLQDIRQIAAAVEQTVPMVHQNRSEMLRIRGLTKTIVGLYKSHKNHFLAQSLRDTLFSHAGGRIQGDSLLPMFEKLITDHSITAWVSATDGTAFAACSFLRQHGIRIPAEISVCGFDNSLQATIERLSSYDFDTAGMFTRAMSSAAGRVDAKDSNRRTIEWPGAFIARQTTGTARG